MWLSRRLQAGMPPVPTALGPVLAKHKADSANTVARHFTAAEAAKTR